jgi:hypothetical protein
MLRRAWKAAAERWRRLWMTKRRMLALLEDKNHEIGRLLVENRHLSDALGELIECYESEVEGYLALHPAWGRDEDARRGIAWLRATELLRLELEPSGR